MTQQHKIMRMVLELADCPAEAAPQAQAGLRKAQHERLLPAIERVCSALGAPDRVHRIDRLELDLGALPLHALEAELGERFEAAFTRQLGAALHDAPAVDAHLELLSSFIASGSLPWWADAQDRGLLASTLQRLLARSAQTPWQALAAAPHRASAHRRLVRALPDQDLDAWLATRLPTASAAGAAGGHASDWLAPLERAGRSLGLAPRQTRHPWWEALLGLADPAGATPTPDWPVDALRRLALALGVEWPALVLALEQTAAIAPPWVRETLQPQVRLLLRDGTAGLTSTALSAPATPGPARAHPALARLLADLAQTTPPDQDLWLRLRVALEGLPAAQGALASAALAEALRAGPPQDATARRTLARRLRELTDANSAAPPAVETGGRAGPAAAAAPAPGAPAAARGFSHADEVYVQNAGLVILWPFLPAFLARLGLVDERRFVDAAAAHRAAGLLQYLASGDEDPPEQLLPLNKLLCGLAADAVFDFGPALAAAEIDECQDLLTAVIQQAPILREMSLAGFRGSFLLRRGQLSAHGDHWLLRVERETHDIVLERFPWGFNPVKLPWMRALLQVEW